MRCHATHQRMESHSFHCDVIVCSVAAKAGFVPVDNNFPIPMINLID